MEKISITVFVILLASLLIISGYGIIPLELLPPLIVFSAGVSLIIRGVLTVEEKGGLMLKKRGYYILWGGVLTVVGWAWSTSILNIIPLLTLLGITLILLLAVIYLAYKS
ncbi:MAG: hypothetical protein J7L38_01415 [Thermoproteales archaeon]|nr:hypothetical protein [Thermoproteales archaeon]